MAVHDRIYSNSDAWKVIFDCNTNELATFIRWRIFEQLFCIFKVDYQAH